MPRRGYGFRKKGTGNPAIGAQNFRRVTKEQRVKGGKRAGSENATKWNQIHVQRLELAKKMGRWIPGFKTMSVRQKAREIMARVNGPGLLDVGEEMLRKILSPRRAIKNPLISRRG